MDALSDVFAQFIAQLCLVQFFAVLTFALFGVMLKLMGIGAGRD